MNTKDSWRDCTEECRSQQHGDFLGAALVLREPTDKELASSLSLLCGNLGSLIDSSGRTLLHMAASVGRRGLVQWLSQRYDVNLNAQDRESGYTPLHRSIFYGQLNVAVALVQLGADINICDNNFLSPIELAMKDRLPDVKYSKNVPCELYVWGTNTNFNLGTDNMQGRMQPEVLDYFRKLNRMVSIVQVHMEKFHTVMLSACGRVWTCGHGQGGRLGLGSERTVLAPMPVPLGSVTKNPLQNPKSTPGQAEVCVAAAVGRDHTLLLMDSYTILVFGLNTHHVLGLSPPPTNVLEPQRLSMKYLEFLKFPPLGVCAGRFHSVIWSRGEILTFGLNAGQLGHAKSLEKTIVHPKPVNALFYKDVEITHVAASDGATVVATGNRHIWVLHEFQRTKLSMRYSIEIEQVVVVGGHLDSDLDPSNLAEKGEPLKVAAISKEGSVFLWQEKDLLMTRCILSPSRQLKIVDVHLNVGRSALLLVTDDGEAFSGEIKPCKKKASEMKPLKGRRNPFSPPNTDVECHVQYKQTERSHIKEFLDPDVCYPVSLERLPHAHRAVKIASDPKGRNFALVQTHPSVYLSNVPELPPEKQGLKVDLLNLLSEANEWDMLHDVVFQVEHRRFPAHQYIVSRHSTVLLNMIQEAKAMSNEDNVPIIKISDISPDIFEQILCYMYTGDCSLTHPKFIPEKIKKDQKPTLGAGISHRKRGNSHSVLEGDDDVVNPLTQARAAGKKLGLTKFVSLLNHVKFQGDDVVWADSKKKNTSKLEVLTVDWKEPSDLCDTCILSKDGFKFNLHKCMLAARSEYFQNMLAGGWIESRETRDLQLPLDQSVLSVLFDYIYKDVTPSLDKVGAVDFELAMQCLIAADLLLINPFKMHCEAALASLLSLRNVKMVLELATTYNAPDLRDCCYQFVCLNLPALLETGTLCGLPPPELEGLRDFYCKIHPRMECRVMTPFCDSPPIDFIKELAAGNPILWDEEIDFEALDDHEMQKKAKLSSSKKKSRMRRISENHRLHNRTDSVSSTNSDDMDTSLDPEPLDWSDLVEKEESEISEAIGKVSLIDIKQKAEKHNDWIKVLSNSKAHKTVQARLKAAATVREEMIMELASSPKQDAPVTTLLLQPFSPPSPSLPQSTLKQVVQDTPTRCVAPETSGKHFPQLGCIDISRGSSKISVVPMQSVNEKRLSKLSQKQRKRLAAEDDTLSSSPTPVAVRGWGQQEEVSPPPSLSLADIMHEQLKRSKQNAPTKPISIKRSSIGSSPHAPLGSGSPWGRVDIAMSPSTPPTAPSLPTCDSSPDKSDLSVRFSDIMADEMTQKENWTRMRTKSLNLTQIEDRAIEDLISFYNANEASEERITVRRVLSNRVARPVWIKSKH